MGLAPYACWTVVTIYHGFTAKGVPKQVVNVYAEPDEKTARRAARRIEKRFREEQHGDDLVVKVRRAWTIPDPEDAATV